MGAIEWFLSKYTIWQLVKVLLTILGIIGAACEFSKKIKWSPFSSMLHWVGERTNKEITQKVDNLEAKFGNLDKTAVKLQSEIIKVQNCGSEKNAIDCRVRILRFGDEIRQGIRHSKETFDQALSDIDTYEKYCSTHPNFQNNKTVMTIQKIKEEYQRAMDENDFL